MHQHMELLQLQSKGNRSVIKISLDKLNLFATPTVARKSDPHVLQVDQYYLSLVCLCIH